VCGLRITSAVGSWQAYLAARMIETRRYEMPAFRDLTRVAGDAGGAYRPKLDRGPVEGCRKAGGQVRSFGLPVADSPEAHAAKKRPGEPEGSSRESARQREGCCCRGLGR
jgi:hypothetical protein